MKKDNTSENTKSSANTQLLIRLFAFAVIWSIIAWGLSNLFNTGRLTYHSAITQSEGIFALAAIIGTILICIIELLIRKRRNSRDNSETTPFLIKYSIDKFIAAIIRCIPPIAFMIYFKINLKTIGLIKASNAKGLLIGTILGVGYMVLGNPSLNIREYKKKHIDSLFRAIIAGINEEFLFRGFLQTLLVAWIDFPIGWFVSSVLFSLWHYPQEKLYNGKSWLDSFQYPLRTLPVSLLLGMVFYFTGNIIAPIVLHLIMNLSAELPKNFNIEQGE